MNFFKVLLQSLSLNKVTTPKTPDLVKGKNCISKNAT